MIACVVIAALRPRNVLRIKLVIAPSSEQIQRKINNTCRNTRDKNKHFMH